jgi:hypothetical protein
MERSRLQSPHQEGAAAQRRAPGSRPLVCTTTRVDDERMCLPAAVRYLYTEVLRKLVAL